MMTEQELRRLAKLIVEEQANNPEWMMAKVKAEAKMRKGKTLPHWVNAKVAADVLGISVRTMREIKESFTYIKSGSSRQGNIYFDANLLTEEYDRYLAQKNRTINMIPLKVVAGS